MFWKNSFTSFSPIQQILNKENFTLEELLEEDDLIQECRTSNSKLIAFLEKREIVDRLLSYLVDPQPDAGVADPFGNHDDFGGSDFDMERSEDMKRRQRFPFAACEVFCCEIDAIFNTLLENDDLMAKLFGLLHNPAPLSAITAGYFARVVATVLVRRPADMLDCILENESVRQGLLKHVANPSISEVIVRIMGADEHVAPLLAPSQMHRLTETSLLHDLVALLTELKEEPSVSSGGSTASTVQDAFDLEAEGRAQAAKILAAVAHSQAIRESPLAQQLGQEKMLKGMLDAGLRSTEGDRPATLLVAVLTVILALLEPKRGIPGFEDVGGDHLPGDPKVASNTISAILPRLSDLVGLLRRETGLSSLPEMHLPYGSLEPPLGPSRLRIVELLSLLVKKGGSEAQQAIIQTNALHAVMDLFEKFPFNNLLHRRVQTILMDGLESGSSALVSHLLWECDMLDWLAQIDREVEPKARPGFEPRTLRAGYMGHVNDMGNRVLEMMLDREDLRAAKERSEHFRQWCAHDLRAESQVAALDSWLCGRPNGGIGKLGMSEFSMGSSNPFLHQPLDDDDDDEDEEEEGKEGGSPGASAAATAPMKIAGTGSGRYEIIEDDEEEEEEGGPALDHLRIGSPDRPRGASGRKRYGANPSGLESPPSLDDFALEEGHAAGLGAALPLSSAAAEEAGIAMKNAFEVDWAVTFSSAAAAAAGGAAFEQPLTPTVGSGLRFGLNMGLGMGWDANATMTAASATVPAAPVVPEEPVAAEFTGMNYWKTELPIVEIDE